MEAIAFGSVLNTLLPQLWQHRQEAKDLRIAIEIDIHYVNRELRMVKALLDEGYILAKGTGRPDILSLDSQVKVLHQETQVCIKEFVHGRRMSCREFGMKIKEFRKKVDEVYNSFQHKLPLLQEPVSHQPPYPYVESKHLVGMGKPLGELLELLKTPAPPSVGRLLKVISIVGFGGLGKTLLAREVYESEVGKEYLTRARVTAAANPVVKILKDILEKVNPERKQDESILDSEKLCDELKECLSKKRYIIVIDDMQKTEQWNIIKYAFPNDMDSIIMVTTTLQEVAITCSDCINGYVYKLSPLDDEESLNLYKKECRTGNPDSAADLLKKCDGLPLAIVSVAHILHSQGGSTMEKCKETCRNLGADLLKTQSKVEKLQWVLMNKYSGLPSHALRSCLLYFSMYKQNMGQVPSRNSLLRRWHAEGFVDAHTGCEILKTLVNRNIVQSTEVSTSGTIRRCRPPGMMVEYISQISMSDNFAASVSDAVKNPTNRIHRLSFHRDSATDMRRILEMDLKIVMSLAVSGIGCQAILDFEKYELLGVLDLKECKNLNEGHVRFICRLLLLKYLSLGESIDRIPRRIERLELLETLEMSTTKPVMVYEEVLRLPKLKHLLGKFELQKVHQRLENFLENKSSLETISGFVTDNTNEFPQLMFYINRLRKIKICCDSTASETNLEGLSKVIKQFTRTEMGGKDRSLSIDFNRHTSLPQKFLQDLGSLRSLKLHGDLRPFQRSLFRRSIQHFTQLSGINKLCLSHTCLSGEVVLLGLANLDALEYLKLEEQNLGPLEINTGAFKGLVRLCLVARQRLHGITIQQQCETLPSLASLHLICEALDPGLESLIGLGFPRHIKEIALHSGVDPDIKKAWKAAALKHPNWPNVC